MDSLSIVWNVGDTTVERLIWIEDPASVEVSLESVSVDCETNRPDSEASEETSAGPLVEAEVFASLILSSVQVENCWTKSASSAVYYLSEGGTLSDTSS